MLHIFKFRSLDRIDRNLILFLLILNRALLLFKNIFVKSEGNCIFVEKKRTANLLKNLKIRYTIAAKYPIYRPRIRNRSEDSFMPRHA